MFRLKESEERAFKSLSESIISHPDYQSMKKLRAHGRLTVFDHSISVARCALAMNRRLKLKADEQQLITGALLHDFYLYDWHCCHNITRWHGFKHPLIARYNAETVFKLNEAEKNIIQSHMWPLTITWLPRCREAVLVCLADKMSSAWETVMERRAAQPVWQQE